MSICLFEFCICFNFFVCGVSCATDNRRSHFNQLTSHGLRLVPALMHHFVVRRLRFQSFQITMLMKKSRSELPGDKSHQHTAHQTFWEEYTYIYISCALYDEWRVPSMWRAVPASWDFSVAHGGMTCQLEAWHQQRKVIDIVRWRFTFLPGLWDTVHIIWMWRRGDFSGGDFS